MDTQVGVYTMSDQSVTISIEERLTAAEAAIAELQSQTVMSPAKENWLEKITGSFKDDPVFEEILRYGQEFRQPLKI
jgi:hypothetical protein